MLRIADVELVKTRLKLLEIAATGDAGATTARAEELEAWIFRDPKPGLIERVKDALSLGLKTK